MGVKSRFEDADLSRCKEDAETLQAQVLRHAADSMSLLSWLQGVNSGFSPASAITFSFGILDPPSIA